MKAPILAAFCAVVASYATAAFAQDAPPSCIYDSAAGAFRAYDAEADAALVRDTLAGRERPDTVMIAGQRFEYSEPLRGTADELNRLVRPRAVVDGARYFSVADPGADLTAAIAGPEYCLLEAYRYAPIVHGAWVEEQPFVFHFPALAVDAASVRLDGDRGHGIGFLMRGHPHPDDDPALYYRQTIESDCAGERTRIIDTRSYGPENKLLQRFREDGAWVANDDLIHPATRMLAHLVCEPPAEWPASTRLDSLDAFSAQVHAAAHAQ